MDATGWPFPNGPPYLESAVPWAKSWAGPTHPKNALEAYRNVAERLASIADDACRADQGYFALHPGDQFKVRRFIPGEDTRVNSLNDHRGETTWTMTLTFRCEIPRHDGGRLA